jgi:hypothetical protein
MKKEISPQEIYDAMGKNTRPLRLGADECNAIADAAVITRSEYNQVVDGLRMQWQVLARENNGLKEEAKLLREQRAEQMWVADACCRIATSVGGWEQVEEHDDRITQVKALRAKAEAVQADKASLEREIAWLKTALNRARRGKRKMAKRR